MGTSLNVLLIGTGRVAFHLGHALKVAGVSLVGVVGRSPERTSSMANELNVPSLVFGSDLPKADVLLIAVSDDAIAPVAASIPVSDAVVVHTSGASDLDRLAPHVHRGVLWPLMTMSPGLPMDLTAVPMVTDGNTQHAKSVVRNVAQRISSHVSSLDHADRELVHTAAALSTNLSLFLLGEAQRLLREAGIDPDLLIPAFRMMATKAGTVGPEEALTGPARRGDHGTIERHLDRLARDPDLRRAYALLSNMILRTYGHTEHGPADV
ncbi:MAG: DUF2520 domain-containing protein [Flavobacteriales bacterium]|nr:DUF2520 domain-containing protein [Flavobacteriales bacterium]